MGNIIGSFISGFTRVIGNLFGDPFDFISGKSCSSVCGPTWDLICYIENFCVANLLKVVMVLVLFYIVLLFIYMLYKMGICSCVGRSLCKMLWACFVSCFSVCEYGCRFLWVKVIMLKRRRREHLMDLEEYDSSDDEFTDESLSYHMPRSPIEVRRSPSHRSREYRKLHLRRSLRPRNHRIRVGIDRGSVYMNNRNPIKHGKHHSTVHNIRVTQMSKFVQKGSSINGRIYRRRYW